MRRNNSSVLRLFSYVPDMKKAVFVAILLTLIGTALSLVSPVYNGKIIDHITDGIKQNGRVDTSVVIPMVILILILKLLQFLSDVLMRAIMVFVTTKITRTVRTKLIDKLDRLPMSYFFNNPAGDTLSRVTNDVDVVNQNLAQCTVNLAGSVVAVVATLVVMLVFDRLLTLVCIGLNAIQVLVISVVTLKSSKFFAKQMNTLGMVNGYIEENYSGHGIVLAYNAEQKSEKRFGRLNDELKKAAFSAQAISGLAVPLATAFTFLSTMLLLLTGVTLSMNGSRTLGLVISFIGFNTCLSTPINTLIQSLQPLVTTKAVLTRIFELLDAEEMSEDGEGTLPVDTRGSVRFEHLKFGYVPEKVVIKDFSEEIKPGQKVAIVGPTGAGKSTLINLLMRFYEPNDGKIFVDGVDISTISRKSLRDKFSIVLQEPWVFEDTIRETLTLGKEVKPEAVEAALKAVGLDYFVSTLPKGYETVLDSHLSLSAGQKQQICIARAIIADKPVVILDEATSSIDTRTELLIQRAMDQLMEGRTSFVIAHRLSTIVNADVILVMNDGDICESGNHIQLLERKGMYYDLYNSQFDN